MSRPASASLLRLTESFFYTYLQHTRGASPHTVRAYRDALKLFYMFLADQKHKSISELALDDIQCDAVLGLLLATVLGPLRHFNLAHPRVEVCSQVFGVPAA